MSDVFSYSRPAGCPDGSGPEPLTVRRLEEALLRRIGRYGYELLDLPILEYTDLFSPDTVGHDLFHRLITARVSESAIFPAADDAAEGYRTSEVALRPELTAQVSRWLVGELLAGGEAGDGSSPALPARIAYAGPVFRNVEPAVAGRREFRQVGAELVGGDPAWGDREILALAADCADALGFEEWEVHIGHTGLYREILQGFEIEESKIPGVARHLENASHLAWELRRDDAATLPFLRHFARTHRSCFPPELTALEGTEAPAEDLCREKLPALYEAYLRRLWTGPEYGLDAEAAERLIALGRLNGSTDKIHEKLSGYLATAEAQRLFQELEALCYDLHKMRKATPIVTAASRGLAYYSGMTFEIYARKAGGGAHSGGDGWIPVCGGGRYDGLHGHIYRRAAATARLRDPEAELGFEGSEDLLTGVGLAFRLDRAAAALGDTKTPRRDRPVVEVLIAAFDPDAHSAAFQLAEKLRAEGRSARCQLAPPGASLTPETQRREAGRLGARVLATYLSGAAGEVHLESGRQHRTVSREDAVREILVALEQES